MKEFKDFARWYFGLFPDILKVFCWWGNDPSAWPAIVALVIGFIVYLITGKDYMEQASSLGNWLVAGTTTWLIIVGLIFGPLVVAYRRYKDNQNKLTGAKAEIDKLNVRELVFFPEEDRHHLPAGDSGNLSYHYSVAIRNTSECESIPNCMVSWLSSKPRVPNVSSADLHRSGASHKHKIPSRIAIPAQRHEVYDFLRTWKSEGGQAHWFVPVDWDENGVEIDIAEYEVTLLASGDKVRSTPLTIKIRPMGDPLKIIVEKLRQSLPSSEPAAVQGEQSPAGTIP